MLTPEERALHGRIGAYKLHSTHDSRELTAKARAASPSGILYFERKVDPDGTLEPKERRRRAEYARKEHMARMTLNSVKARRAKADS